jgi:hypothetical protein
MTALLALSDPMMARKGTPPGLDGLGATSILFVQSAGFIAARLQPDGLGVYIVFAISRFLAICLLALDRNGFGIISPRLFCHYRIVDLDTVIITFMPRVIDIHTWLGRPARLPWVLVAMCLTWPGLCLRKAWLAAAATSTVAFGLAAIGCCAIQRPVLRRRRCLWIRQLVFALPPARPYLSIALGT